MNKTIIIILLVLVLGIGGYFIFKGDYQAPSSGLDQQDRQQPPPGTESKKKSVAIKNFVFSPANLIVKVGESVTWKNEDSSPHQIASDPHPVHTDLPGLFSGVLSRGETYSFAFTQTGNFSYHCHLHPSMKGTIVVEQ